MKKKNSSDWCNHFGIDRNDIMDPDGWDRWNFDASWNEIIDMQEFLRRLRISTGNRESHRRVRNTGWP